MSLDENNLSCGSSPNKALSELSLPSSKFEVIVSKTSDPSSPCSLNFFNEDSLNNSPLFSINSPLLTEELIINENIDFLMNSSGSVSNNLSFTYSKSEIASGISSIFHSFEASNVLTNSLPQSHSESLSLNRKSYESVEPRAWSSELKFPYLKIPQFNLEGFKLEDNKQNADNLEYDKNYEEIFDPPIINVMPVEMDSGEENLHNYVACDLSPGKLMEINIERQSPTCTCVWCNII